MMGPEANQKSKKMDIEYQHGVRDALRGRVEHASFAKSCCKVIVEDDLDRRQE